MEGSSSEDHHDDDDKVASVHCETKKQDEIGDSTHETRQQADDGDLVLELQDVTRICKRDTKKERREKYKMCFERNHVCMVSTVCTVISDGRLSRSLSY